MGDGSYIDYYAFYAEAGQNASLELRSSSFDAYLILFDDDWSVLAMDDDSAGNLNARIDYVLPYSGMYIVGANTYFSGEVGPYTLSLTLSDPLDIDFDRAIELIEQLRDRRQLSDAELAEAETLLMQLLHVVHWQR